MSSLPPQSHLLPFPRPPPRGRHGRELPLGPVGRGLDSRVGELRGLRTSAPAAPTPRASAMPSVHGGAAVAYQAVPPGAPYKAEPLCNRRNRHTPQHATSFRESRFDDAISPRAKKKYKNKKSPPTPHPWARLAAPPPRAASRSVRRWRQGALASRPACCAPGLTGFRMPRARVPRAGRAGSGHHGSGITFRGTGFGGC